MNNNNYGSSNENNNSNSNEASKLVSEKLYSLLLRCSHALSRGHHQHTGIHPGQQRVLSLLAANDKITQHDLLDVMQIRAASLSELLTKLESKGLIARMKTDGTKRGMDVEITELGEMAAAEYARNRQEATGELFSVLSEEEQKQLVLLLSKLIENWNNLQHGQEWELNRFHGHGGHGHEGHHHDRDHRDMFMHRRNGHWNRETQ